MNKQEIIDVLHQKTTEKIQGLEKLIDETRASNNDTKSSMGDKYETGREMLQQQINNLQIQLNEVMKQQAFLKSIVAKSSQKVEKGAVVSTERGVFFISVSLGEITLNDYKIMCISPESPLAKAMNGKSVNDIFTLNNVNHTIINIE
ncbi:GreA/GreB family elongation factor [Chryseobacterium binzhouense]|uniref:GreA/GreB family elongation factor n=1 Tax=Chryseobacterium binzhouense TaxID=2593646 RepID=UPI001180699D|nr:GreA/GreB family elongation factor [Chryseobacterium binzhouense]MXS70176.1 hypothetical protein [Flavobacteriaceae bacterium W22]